MKYIITLFVGALCGFSVIARPGAADSLAGGPVRSFRNDGPYAFIAGGSKGIGYGIAEALAKRHFNLILVARHYDSLLAAKNKLEERYGVKVEILVRDLADDKAAAELGAWCAARETPLKMLCNVAGLGGTNDYLSLPLDSLQYMVRLNVGSCMGLTLALLPLLERNAPSYVLNVASMAGFAPIPVKNMYSATKSAIIFFSYSLREQLRSRRISVSCLCPGPVFTKPSIVQDTREKLGWIGMKMALYADRVGEVAVKRTLKERMIIVPGTLAALASIPVRLLPVGTVVRMYSKRATPNP